MAIDAPLENTPILYQYWGTFQVIEALLQAGVEAGYRVEREQLFTRDATGVFLKLLPNGQPAVVLQHPVTGTQVSLIPERTYRPRKEGASHTSRFISTSHELRPDVVIEVTPAEGPSRIFLFDPKYKSDSEGPGSPEGNDGFEGKAKKEDINKMHVYHDAIRDQQGKQVVECAAILFPGPTESYKGGVAALRALPGEGGLVAEVKRRLRL